MNLFQTGSFTLHSGEVSTFKIDCDALTKKDLQAIALQLTLRVAPFSAVKGVPRGGLKLAAALQPYVSYNAGRLLIVDDVFTTGASMEEFRDSMNTYYDPIGAVIFARGKTPSWITPLFRM